MGSFTPKYEITDEILKIILEITGNLDEIADITVLEKMPKLTKMLLAKEINSLISIENFFLEEDKLQTKITEKIFLGKDGDYLAYHNLTSAYREAKVISPTNIRDFYLINEIIEKKINQKAGKLRAENKEFISTNETTYFHTPKNFIKQHLNILFDYLKTSKTIMLIKAIVFTYNLELLYPFASGNEKTKLYWLKLLLSTFNEKLSFAPINTKILNNFKEYQNITQKAFTTGDLTDYILFMLEIINGAVIELRQDSSDYSFYLSSQVEALMRVMEIYPLSLFDLMGRLKLKSRDGFRKNYILPALEAGLIGMTEPNKPTSKNQKYFKL